ncbi:DUF4232 domain-containing protein [Streptomyces sp. DSM 44917]|uniref:DUF4232 domain-containing protein n=1 Tax=Streptomyces boetiae TaxID=3075541 RepID=A0ABU2LE91_9ACTN|nr:DUF4232 domain-containing protein [Streptomyces sp. DSM 44917]MDT0309890.1 DUF4232 domain-containing protein [Streptomyces sp. DSM 44917]
MNSPVPHRRSPLSRVAALAGCAALAALAVAGCGEGSEDPAAGATTAAGPAPESSAPAEEPASPGQDGQAPTPGQSPDPTGSDGSPSPQAPAGDPWCAPESLSAALSPLDPGAGQRYAALVLTNTSDVACRTEGWPGLRLTAGDGSELPTTTVRDRSSEPRRVTLEPGASAWTRLHWTTVPGEEDPETGCGPDPAALAVIPPDTYSPTSADWDLGAVCSAGRIEALPLAAGTGPDGG